MRALRRGLELWLLAWRVGQRGAAMAEVTDPLWERLAASMAACPAHGPLLQPGAAPAVIGVGWPSARAEAATSCERLRVAGKVADAEHSEVVGSGKV
jgi:hypothetical protein